MMRQSIFDGCFVCLIIWLLSVRTILLKGIILIDEQSEFLIFNYPQKIPVDNIQEGLNRTISKNGHVTLKL